MDEEEVKFALAIAVLKSRGSLMRSRSEAKEIRSTVFGSLFQKGSVIQQRITKISQLISWPCSSKQVVQERTLVPIESRTHFALECGISQSSWGMLTGDLYTAGEDWVSISSSSWTLSRQSKNRFCGLSRIICTCMPASSTSSVQLSKLILGDIVFRFGEVRRPQKRSRQVIESVFWGKRSSFWFVNSPKSLRWH